MCELGLIAEEICTIKRARGKSERNRDIKRYTFVTAGCPTKTFWN